MARQVVLGQISCYSPHICYRVQRFHIYFENIVGLVNNFFDELHTVDFLRFIGWVLAGRSGRGNLGHFRQF